MANKTNVVPLAGASPNETDRDARKMRSERPYVRAYVKASDGVLGIPAFIEKNGGMRSSFVA